MERFLDMIRDEPWLFGIPFGGEKAFLAEQGLELGDVVSIGGEESVARYLTRSDRTVVGASALARMEAMRRAAVSRILEQADPSQRAAIEERLKSQDSQVAYRIVEAFPSRISAGN
jgi:hypothetical protein